MDQLSNGEGNLRFDHGTDKENEGEESSETDDGDSSDILDETDFMVQESLYGNSISRHMMNLGNINYRSVSNADQQWPGSRIFLSFPFSLERH